MTNCIQATFENTIQRFQDRNQESFSKHCKKRKKYCEGKEKKSIITYLLLFFFQKQKLSITPFKSLCLSVLG